MGPVQQTSWRDGEAFMEEPSMLDEACPRCRSHFVRGYEINDDNPDAMEHEAYYCAVCGADRG